MRFLTFQPFGQTFPPLTTLSPVLHRGSTWFDFFLTKKDCKSTLFFPPKKIHISSPFPETKQIWFDIGLHSLRIFLYSTFLPFSVNYVTENICFWWFFFLEFPLWCTAMPLTSTGIFMISWLKGWIWLPLVLLYPTLTTPIHINDFMEVVKWCSEWFHNDNNKL